MSKKEKIEIIHLGKARVDSGILLVCDPCYIDSEWIEEEFDNKDSKHNFSYNACCQASKNELNGQLLGEENREIGVAFKSGLGDGIYDIYGIMKNFEIAHIIIDLIPNKDILKTIIEYRDNMKNNIKKEYITEKGNLNNEPKQIKK